MRIKTLLPIIAIVLCACQNEEKTRVACVGDSITEGFGIAWQSDNAYPTQLAQILDDSYEVMNFGRSSTTMMRDGDFPYWSAKEFTNTLRYRPDIVVLKLGTNDCKAYQWNADKFKASYLAMVDTLRSVNPEVRIIACLPVPVKERKWEMNDSVITEGVIPVIREVAAEQNLDLIDLYALLAPHDSLFCDGIHPNRDGAHLMAEAIAAKIRE